MKKTKETSVVNPAADDEVATDDLIETGEQAIARYADGLETTDEAVAALDATDRQLLKVQRGKRKNATRPRTTKHSRSRTAKRTLTARKTKATTRVTTKRANARAKRR
jgi:hypothetical protein